MRAEVTPNHSLEPQVHRQNKGSVIIFLTGKEFSVGGTLCLNLNPDTPIFYTSLGLAQPAQIFQSHAVLCLALSFV